jgi:hypothetical protein
MLKDERPHGVGVALGANGELTGGGAHLVTHFRPMRIMTVAALDEPHIYSVTIGSRKLGLLRGMASIAQGSLRLY